MDIWLLRHAMAEERSGSGRDADRELTPDGLRRAERVARGLAALSPDIEAVWTSPYRRARQTAEPAAQALGLESKLSETRALEPDRDPAVVLEGEEAAAELGLRRRAAGGELRLPALGIEEPERSRQLAARRARAAHGGAARPAARLGDIAAPEESRRGVGRAAGRLGDAPGAAAGPASRADSIESPVSGTG